MQLPLRLGASLGIVAVLAGTFAAHLLPKVCPGIPDADLATFEKGVRYLMFHALALLACAALAAHGLRVRAASLCLAAGAGIFAGTLFFLTTTGPRWLGAITPIGGTLMIVGWVLLLLAARSAAARAT